MNLAPDFLSIEYRPADHQLVSLIHEALSLLPREDFEIRSLLLARLSTAMSWSGDPQEGRALASLAQKAAERSNSLHCRTTTTSAATDALPGPLLVKERLVELRKLRTLVLKRNQPADTLNYFIREIAAQLEGGEIRIVDSRIAELSSYLEDAQLPQYAWYPIAYRAMRSLMTGDFNRAHSLGEQFTEAGRLIPDANIAASRACQACCIALETGISRKVIDLATAFVLSNSERRSWAAGRALLLLHAGRKEEAREALSTFTDDSLTDLTRESGGGAGIAFLAEITAIEPGPFQVRTLYEICASLAGTSATLGSGMGYFGVFDRYAGMLAQTLHDFDASQHHLTTAIALELERGAHIAANHCRLDLANLYVSHGQTTSARKQLEAARRAVAHRQAHRVHRRIAALDDLLSV
jgi:hypothetical protein